MNALIVGFVFITIMIAFVAVGEYTFKKLGLLEDEKNA